MDYRVSVVIEHDDDGHFAYSPELPGCFSQGDSHEEAMANIKEAVALYLESLDPDERLTLHSKEISASSVEVSIA